MTSIRNTNKNITRLLTKIENAVASKLDTFYRKKIKPQARLFPVEAFREKYEQQVKTIIRKAIQESYLTGTNIVTDKISEKNKDFVPFISVTDITNIQSLTEKMNNQFWTTTEKLVRREQEFILDNATKELQKKNSFDDKAAMIGLGALFAYSGFNAAILSKMQNTINLLPVTPIAQTSIDLEIGFELEQLDPFSLPL